MERKNESDIRVFLARIDERTENTTAEIKEIKRRLDEIKSEYVTNIEFKPIKTLVYGFVALIIIAVLTAIIGSVIKTNHSTSTNQQTPESQNGK